MDTCHYETKQAILDEAGLRTTVNAETLSGIANGSNTVFNTTYWPISDTNYDDEVDPTDITVFVNGAPVVVRLVDADAGTITLFAAPPNDAAVTCNYSYSPVTDQYLCQIREEAEEWVNNEMRVIDPIPYGSGVPITNMVVPYTIRKLTRWYAAAQLLTRDYGFGSDTSKTSKDGQMKMAMANTALIKYIDIGGMSGLSDIGASQTAVHGEGHLFSRRDELNTQFLPYSQDLRFMDDLGVDDHDGDFFNPEGPVVW